MQSGCLWWSSGWHFRVKPDQEHLQLLWYFGILVLNIKLLDNPNLNSFKVVNTCIAELCVAFQHCEFLFSIFKKYFFSKNVFKKLNFFSQKKQTL